VGLVLIGVTVFALPDVPRQVAEDTCEVMVAAATGRGCLPQLAAANNATESLTLGLPPERSAAPKRGAVSFRQTT